MFRVVQQHPRSANSGDKCLSELCASHVVSTPLLRITRTGLSGGKQMKVRGPERQHGQRRLLLGSQIAARPWHRDDTLGCFRVIQK